MRQAESLPPSKGGSGELKWRGRRVEVRETKRHDTPRHPGWLRCGFLWSSVCLLCWGFSGWRRSLRTQTSPAATSAEGAARKGKTCGCPVFGDSTPSLRAGFVALMWRQRNRFGDLPVPWTKAIPGDHGQPPRTAPPSLYRLRRVKVT